MKAEITSEGILKIIPENNIEDYALNQWMNHWNKSDTGELTSALQIGRRKPCPNCEHCAGQFFCHSCGRRLIAD